MSQEDAVFISTVMTKSVIELGDSEEKHLRQLLSKIMCRNPPYLSSLPA